jgi:hypothetical protein
MKSKLEYLPVSKRHGNEASKNVNGASTSGTSMYPNVVKNKATDPVLSNSFDMLNMVDNDDDVAISGEKKTNSSNKGPVNLDDINLVDLRSSIEALKEKENVIVNVGLQLLKRSLMRQFHEG